MIFQAQGAPEKLDLDINIDIDSIIWNFQHFSLNEPMFLYPSPPQSMNLTGSHQYVQRPRFEHPVLLDQTPHCLFGKVGLLTNIHVIFPECSLGNMSDRSDYLPSDVLDKWYNSVIYPALKRCVPPKRLHRFRTTRQLFQDGHPGPCMGHLLDPAYVHAVTIAMRDIVEENGTLKAIFNGFFFHASAKGTKESTSISLDELRAPGAFESWRASSVERYSSLFAESERKWVQVDVGVEFTPSVSATRTYGPLHLLWKREFTRRLKMGTGNTPKAYDWWLTHDIAGSVASIGNKDKVDFTMDPPSVSYFQAYHLDKEAIPKTSVSLFSNMSPEDMTWSSTSLRKSWEMLMRGVEKSAGSSWGVRMEIRMAAKHLYNSLDPLGLFSVCQTINDQAAAHMVSLPSVKVARYKACCMWLVRDGAQRVASQVSTTYGDIGPKRTSFMLLLAGLYRGFHRGIDFTLKRSTVFGPMLSTKEESFGIGRSIFLFGFPYCFPSKIDWVNAELSTSGLHEKRQIERRILDRSPMSLASLHVLMDHVALDGAKEHFSTPEKITRFIISLYKKDMINATMNLQTEGTIATWTLDQVRQAIPQRKEYPICKRRHNNTWIKLFRYHFPPPRGLQLPYVKQGRWAKVKYISIYLDLINLLQRYQDTLPPETYPSFDGELWRQFNELDCVIRSSIRNNFVRTFDGYLRIDLRG